METAEKDTALICTQALAITAIASAVMCTGAVIAIGLNKMVFAAADKYYERKSKKSRK